jgi:hypothetical protein
VHTNDEADYDRIYARLKKKQIDGHEKFKGDAKFYLAITAAEPDSGDGAQVQYSVLQASLLITTGSTRPDGIDFLQKVPSWAVNNQLTINTDKCNLTWLQRIGKAASDYLGPTATFTIEDDNNGNLVFKLYANGFPAEVSIAKEHLHTLKDKHRKSVA